MLSAIKYALANNIIIDNIIFNNFLIFSIFSLFLILALNQLITFSCLLKIITIVKIYKGNCQTIIHTANANVIAIKLSFCEVNAITPQKDGSDTVHNENKIPTKNNPFLINFVIKDSFF